MGYFTEEELQEEVQGLNYRFGEAAADVFERWSKILISMQKDIEELKEYREANTNDGK